MKVIKRGSFHISCNKVDNSFGHTFIGGWCNGNIAVSKTVVEGSNPSPPARHMHLWASGRNHGSAKPNPKGHRWSESNQVLKILKCGGMANTAGWIRMFTDICKLTARPSEFRGKPAAVTA